MRFNTQIRRAAHIILAASMVLATRASSQVITSSAEDPRVGLRGGFTDAAEVARNLVLVAHRDRPAGFFTPGDPGAFPTANSDLAFRGNLLFQGSFHGFQIWDISNPASPRLLKSLRAPVPLDARTLVWYLPISWGRS